MALRRAKSTEGHTRRVADLEYAIAESRRLRPLLSDPDHVAVVMQRHARRTLAGLWIFLCLGLVFTTTGVQRFLAAGTSPADPLWWAAWCVEPMFAGLLVTLLNFEAAILSHGVQPGHAWWSRLKHTLLASTLAMNVIPQLAPLLGDGVFNLGSLAVHAIVPLIVYGVAEVIPLIQARTRQIIQQVNDQAAGQPADFRPGEPEPDPVSELSDPAAEHGEPATSMAPETAPPSAPESAPRHIPTADQPTTPGAAAETYPSDTAAPGSDTRPDITDLAAVRSLKLPESVVAKLRDAYDGAAAQGREITTADVQQAVKLPDAMADRIVTELTGHNGHPVAAP
ncbi:hypothetical protein [Bounagaea algeriensis]